MVEVMKIMATSFKTSHAHTAILNAPNPATSHCWPMPLPETHVHSQASLGQSLVGSLLLSSVPWCTQGSVCALQESVSPVLCMSWQLYGGVNGDFLQESLCYNQIYCAQSPCPCSSPLLTCTFSGDTETQLFLSLCGVSGLKGMFEPSEHLWWVWGLILNTTSPLLPSCWVFSFALGCGVSKSLQHYTTATPPPWILISKDKICVIYFFVCLEMLHAVLNYIHWLRRRLLIKHTYRHINRSFPFVLSNQSRFYYIHIYYIWASQVAQVVKNPPANPDDAGRRRTFNFWGKIPQRRKWQPTPVFLPGNPKDRGTC